MLAETRVGGVVSAGVLLITVKLVTSPSDES